MAKPLKVMVLSGGISHERDISLKSGRRVADGLMAHGLEVSLRDPDAHLINALVADAPDVVWPVLHGASGEDGALRGLLDMLGIAYVGSDGESTRLAWNKPVAKTLVERAGVPTPSSITLSRDAFRELGKRPRHCCRTLGASLSGQACLRWLGPGRELGGFHRRAPQSYGSRLHLR